MAENPSSVRIHGKSQSRTVLGIVNAYLVMHPETTAAELRSAFPVSVTHKFAKWDETNADPMRREGLFHEIRKADDGSRIWAATGEKVVASTTIFEQTDETIHLADGTELAMESTWVAEDYKAMVEWARQYSIEVASFEKFDGTFNKGSYQLEYINGFVPQESAIAAAVPVLKKEEKPAEKKEEAEPAAKEEQKSEPASIWPMLLAVLLALLAIILILWLHTFCACHEAKPAKAQSDNTEAAAAPASETVSTETQAKEDSIAAATAALAAAKADSIAAAEAAAKAQEDSLVKARQAEADAIQKSLNALKFSKGKAALTTEMRTALKPLAEMMKADPDRKLKIIGHSSPDGPEALNQKLSESRAKVVVDYLIQQGVSADRLESEGRGSSEPISDVAEENRRTEIKIS